jgi:signal transduction histidine kinase
VRRDPSAGVASVRLRASSEQAAKLLLGLTDASLVPRAVGITRGASPRGHQHSPIPVTLGKVPARGSTKGVIGGRGLKRWRGQIVHVAIDEMTHLALVANRMPPSAACRISGAPTSPSPAGSADPVIDQNEVLGAVMVFRDVTEQKRLQKQLEVADRLASLGTMAAGVAHEINNPLTVVVGNAEFILEHLSNTLSRHEPDAEPQDSETREVIASQRDILSAASRIARIVPT